MPDPRYDDLCVCYKEAKAAWGGWLTQADECLKMYLGDQWTAQEKDQLSKYKRAGYIFNRLKRVVKIVSGYERKNRLSLKIGGEGNEDDPAANQLTKIILRTMNRRGYAMLSECFKWGSLVTGMNLLWMMRDSFGDISFNRSPHNEVMLDPGFVNRDLSDCGYILRGKWIAGRDLLKLFPGEITKEDVAAIFPDQAVTSRWNLGKMRGNVASQERRGLDAIHLVEEHWKQTTRKRLMTIDPQYGTEVEIPKDNQDYLAKLQAAGAPIKEGECQTIQLSLFADGKWLTDIENPYGIDDYPCVFVGGEFCPEQDDFSYRLQSFVQCILDPQRADNRRMNQMLDITESVIHKIYIAKMDSLVDPEGLATGANRKTVFIKKGASTEDVAVKDGGDVPSGLFALQQLMDKQITEIPGINEELFGTENNDVSGVLSKLRQGGALNVLQEEFDNLRTSKSELGRKAVLMVQGSYDKARVQRIINQPPAPKFYNRDLVRYDCTPQEGVLTDSQREMFFVELRTMFETGMYPIPPSMVLKNMPSANKQEMLAAVQQAEQAQAQQSKMAQEIAQVKAGMDAAKVAQLKTETAEIEPTGIVERAKTIAETQNILKNGSAKPAQPGQRPNPKPKQRGR